MVLKLSPVVHPLSQTAIQKTHHLKLPFAFDPVDNPQTMLIKNPVFLLHEVCRLIPYAIPDTRSKALLISKKIMRISFPSSKAQQKVLYKSTSWLTVESPGVKPD